MRYEITCNPTTFNTITTLCICFDMKNKEAMLQLETYLRNRRVSDHFKFVEVMVGINGSSNNVVTPDEMKQILRVLLCSS